MYKVANGLVPQYICDLFTRRSEVAHGTSLRSITNQNFAIPKPKLTLYKESISYSGPVIWNNIPNDIRYLSNVSSFSKNVSNWNNEYVRQLYLNTFPYFARTSSEQAYAFTSKFVTPIYCSICFYT